MTTFIVELLVFLIICFLIGKYIWPALKAGMEKRQEEITASLAAAEAARTDAASAEDERLRLVEEAKVSAAQIVAQGTNTAAQIRASSEAAAQAEYDRLVANAHNEVTLARQRAIDEASATLGSVVMEVVEAVIGREVDAAAHADLIGQAVSALDATPGTLGASR
jgi:F-type H+-transporting ATPase subunit b